MSAQEIETIKVKTGPIIINILESLKAKNYEKMTENFAKPMLDALPASKLEKTNKDTFLPELGEYVSMTFDRIEEKGKYAVVYYLAKFTKIDKVIVQTSFEKGDKDYKVQGLYLKPYPTAKRVDKNETEKLLKALGPVAENYFDGLKDKNFKQMTTHFSDKMLEVLGPEKLRESYEKEVFPVFGTLVSANFDNIDQDANYTYVYYLVKYSKGATLRVKFVFKSGDKEKKIYGLWEKPL